MKDRFLWSTVPLGQPSDASTTLRLAGSLGLSQPAPYTAEVNVKTPFASDTGPSSLSGS